MNVPPDLQFRRRQETDIEDVAATFVEQEVGRYDWKNNWSVYKNKPALQDRIMAWLRLMDLNTDPSALIAEVDRLSTERLGRWV